jgi:uncharacterized membrane protein YedE/YeeE
METSFTPIASLTGGVLIGLAALLMMASVGRIAGISGIVSRLLPPRSDKTGMPISLAFVAGLLLAAPLINLATGFVPEVSMSGNLMLLALAGVLVGFGSVLGSGCTSGHGVCGISRLSARSIAATLTFMATGVAAVYLLRHVFGS